MISDKYGKGASDKKGVQTLSAIITYVYRFIKRQGILSAHVKLGKRLINFSMCLLAPSLRNASFFYEHNSTRYSGEKSSTNIAH
jgi:hypothetical protein